MAITRHRTFLVGALFALAALALPLADAGEAKWRGPSATGKYTGLTEYDGTVRFRVTRGGKVLGFTLTNATMYCSTVPAPGDPRPPEYEKVVTVTHGPMPMLKKSNKNPQGKKFELTDATGYYKGGIVQLTSGPGGGRVLDEVGFNGETYFETTSGPPDAPGTELCGTKLIDWEAKRPGSKGFVAVGNSGHLRPPLSEFAAF